MKTLLCFGDSNTWGYDPATESRLDVHTRWAGVLRDTLGADWWVIEEGLNGRTTVHDDPVEQDGRSGLTYLTPCLHSHKPLDLVIIMLGTNDLKPRFHVPAIDIASGVGRLVQIAQHSQTGRDNTNPDVLLICPPPTVSLESSRFVEMFAGAYEKSRLLAPHYRTVAEELGCHFINAGDVIVSSPLDGIHFEANEHRKLGEHIAAYVRQHFG
ncbi:MAG: SGNH/GDSL hydrolase family protein [Chloroflexota bacterium]|nr:SGNH/GDSL hydrolase family protein [Chloroflexota bacterium]